MYQPFRPDRSNPTKGDAEPVFYVQQAMKVPWIEPQDISNAVLWLASGGVALRHRHATARRRRRLPEVVRLPRPIPAATADSIAAQPGSPSEEKT